MANERLKDLEAEWLALENEAEQDDADGFGGVPEAGEAEADSTAMTDLETIEQAKRVPEAGEAEADKPGDVDRDAADDSGDVPEHQKYAEMRRKARKYEKQMHAADAKREAAEQELAAIKAQLEYAKSRGVVGEDLPELPKGIDRKAVREGDPDAIADALEFIERNLPRGSGEPPIPSPSPARGEGDKSGDAAVPATFDEFLDSLPTSSEVHKLGHWMESKPALFDMAKQVEREVFAAPENQGKTLETLYTEVVRRVEQQSKAAIEQAFKPAGGASTPRSLSAVAGVPVSAGGGLADQFMQLSTAEQVGFYKNLTPRQRDQLDMELEAA